MLEVNPSSQENPKDYLCPKCGVKEGYSYARQILYEKTLW